MLSLYKMHEIHLIDTQELCLVSLNVLSLINLHCMTALTLSKQRVAVWEMWLECKTNTQQQAF